jgi:hypothetical protein
MSWSRATNHTSTTGCWATCGIGTRRKRDRDGALEHCNADDVDNDFDVRIAATAELVARAFDWGPTRSRIATGELRPAGTDVT